MHRMGVPLHIGEQFSNLALFILGPKENFWTAAVFDFRPVSDVIQDGGQWPYWKLTLAISREVNVVNACVITII